MQELEAQQQYQQMQMNTIRSCQMTGYPVVSQFEMSAPFIAGPDAVCPFAYWSGDAQTTQRQSLEQTPRRSMPRAS
jgi:hypothetical protein